MTSATSIIPHGYDIVWIGEKLGLNFTGWAPRAEGVHVSYPEHKFEELTALVDNYEVAYLEKALPLKLAEVSVQRDLHIKGFVFSGIHVELDHETKTNLASAVLGLTRNPSVEVIHWSLGDSNFILLPRDLIFALADAAFMYVQNCFTRHYTLSQECRAATTLTELGAIDITAGWP